MKVGLEPNEAIRVRHPNELFYRLVWRGAEPVAAHFIDSTGPHRGLLSPPVT